MFGDRHYRVMEIKEGANQMRYVIASNGAVHREGCVHANRLRVVNDADTLEEAKRYASYDFELVKVAPCAKAK
ncbi:MAG TPA: hypothetical protein VLA89_07930 [Gemmatimonadales bacterium]|nr:hypothetical protein [Gemmatimonadales bacterium]